MDKLPALGRDVVGSAPVTFQAFGDLLRRPESLALLNSIPREVHRYGDHERQTLDLYRPSSSSGQYRPIFVFVHGGANVSGGSIAPEIPGEVVYKGLAFFLTQEMGYDAVVMNYRLLQHGAVFNSGGQDLDLVIRWIEENLCTKRDEPRTLFIMGNSAGGVHLAGWLFDKQFTGSTQRVTEPSAKLFLSRAIILSSTLLADPDNSFVAHIVPHLLRYYTTRELIVHNAPINLMRRKYSSHSKDDNGTILRCPKLLLIATEYDPVLLIDTMKQLTTEWKDVGGQAEYWELPGHNHLSPPLALGTGDKAAEAWGFELAKRLSVDHSSEII
ncbi:uncharacterized protein A1O9_03595 [Exophiala aquamarina CBS 119918]|uniref:BD-FAE-like domain-containing protein n=1 Tax=Exophiala aquamarina CBS 119918 TaxID=1182545 RepID=A0A072PRQ9_9EURO|nr:uncharacterized protein A1O9_03595 [Exophiala aquamarina CBS 119918]KEF62023.1 hypothetical protein A1O9_03595 [Exophiala aquamarina CBS 119918]